MALRELETAQSSYGEGTMTAFRKGSEDEAPQLYMAKVRGWPPQGLGMLLGGILLLILLYASVAYVPAGHVGVLTLFGRGTGDVLPEGTHLVNPFKGNNAKSIRQQELKETARVHQAVRVTLKPENSSLF